MRLSLEQIKEITAGALWIEEEADGIHFGKCTKKQEAAFLVLNQGLGERSLTTTGVRLDFHTNSKHLRFFASSGRKFEVLVNDQLRRQFDCDILRAEGTCAELALTDPFGHEMSEVRVTLVFPSHTVGVLEYVELDDGAWVKPHQYDRKILFIGDSITQGWNSYYDCFSYAWRVIRFFNADSINQGIGGAYYHESTFDTIDFEPDTVIVALGTNDFSKYKTKEEMRLHVAAHLELIAEAYRGRRILVISPIWRDTEDKEIGSFEDVRRIPMEEAERLGLSHIDGMSLMPPMAEFMADKTLHPNALGFSLYAENLIAQMIKF